MATLLGTYEYDLNRLAPTPSANSVATMNQMMWTLVHQLLDSFGAFSPGFTGAWTHAYSSTGYGSVANTHHLSNSVWWNGGTYSANTFATGQYGASQNGAMFALRAPADFPGVYRPTILFVADAPVNGNSYDWCVFITNGTINSLPATVGDFPVAYLPGGAVAPWTTSRSGTGGQSYDWFTCLNSSDTTPRNCHLVMATDGAFFWSCGKFGTPGRLYNGVAVLPFEDAQAADLCPWAFFTGGPTWSDANPDWPSAAYTSPKSGWSAARLMGRVQVVGNYAVDCVHSPNGHYYDGYSILSISTSGTSATPIYPVFPTLGGAVRKLATKQGGGSPDPVRGTYPEFPVWVSDYSSNIRGRLRDLWLCYPHAEGTVEPSGAVPVKRMCWGEFWIPAPDLASPISW